MRQIISVVLSLALLFQSAAPALAQVRPSVSAENIKNYLKDPLRPFPTDNLYVAHTEQMRQVAEQQLQFALEREKKRGDLPREVREAVMVLTAPEAESTLSKEQSISKEEQEAAAAGLAYVQSLSERIYDLGKRDLNAAWDLIEEGLPVFASVGGVNREIKEWAAQALRRKLEQDGAACETAGFWKRLNGEDEKRSRDCESVLRAVSALAVLGQSGNSADARAVANVLNRGYNGPMGPAVIMVAGTALYAMEADDLLVAQLHEVSTRQPSVGLLGKDFSFLALQDYVKAAKSIWEQGDWGEGEDYAYYPAEGRALGNAWTDLGKFLGEEAALSGPQGARAQSIIHRVFSSVVTADRRGVLGLRFPSFVSGVLSGGYRLETLGRQGYELDRNGNAYYANTQENWDRLIQNLQSWHINLTGWAALKMYFQGKSNLDPYTKTAINNMLVDIYQQSGNTAEIKGFDQKESPTEAELNSYQNWQTASRVAGAADTALAVVGTLALGAGAVKGVVSGARLVGRLGRTFKLARAGAAASGMKFTSSYARVVRLGRMQKAAAARASAKATSALASSPQTAVAVPVPGRQKVKTHNLSAARLERSVVSANVTGTTPSLVLKRGTLLNADMEQNILKVGGEDLLRAVERKLNLLEAPAPIRTVRKSGKKARRAAQRAAAAEKKAKRTEVPSVPKAAQPTVLPRTHEAFFQQDKSLLLRYLRNTYSLTPDALKDMSLILSRAETLPDGMALKKAVFARTEELLGRKDILLKRYASSVKRSGAKPSVRVYYLADKDHITFSSFDPAQITLALEEPLQAGTLQDLPSVIRQVNSAKTPWHMSEKGVASISWQNSHQKITASDMSRLYSHLLDCSAYRPCFYEFNGANTLMLYRADKKLWLRVGEHEVVNKFHLHLHTDKLFPVEGGIHNGMERVVLNYRIPLTDVQYVLHPASRAVGKGAYGAYVVPVNQTQSYRLFVTDALEQLKNANAVIPLP